MKILYCNVECFVLLLLFKLCTVYISRPVGMECVK